MKMNWINNKLEEDCATLGLPLKVGWTWTGMVLKPTCFWDAFGLSHVSFSSGIVDEKITGVYPSRDMAVNEDNSPLGRKTGNLDWKLLASACDWVLPQHPNHCPRFWLKQKPTLLVTTAKEVGVPNTSGLGYVSLKLFILLLPTFTHT